MVDPTSISRPRRLLRVAAALAAVGLCVSLTILPGCSTNPEVPVEVFQTVPAPLPPVFMKSPVALLLTNSSSYAAQVAVTETIGGQDETVTGDLLVQGTRILFAPHADKEGERRYAKEGKFSFLWMADQNKGFVLSESMQAYAPVSLGAAATNLVIEPGGAGEFIDGQPCRVQTAIAHLDNGTVAAFKTWRATALNGVPLRILSLSNSPAAKVSLSRIRSQAVPQELLAPPSGFTRFASAETMAEELALRQRNLKRKSWESY